MGPIEGTKQVVIVGLGLAGCSAAITLATSGLPIEVILLEREAKPGGNSMKASSGMNALTPETGDSHDIYLSDTLSSGGGLSSPDLVDTLVSESQAALAFLGALGVDLPQVVQLGGHSRPRTHTSNKGGANVGFVIMKALLDRIKVEPRVQLRTGCRLTEIVKGADGAVQGVKFLSTPAPPPTPQPAPSPPSPASAPTQESLPCDAVILATGGFGASRALLSRYCGEGIATLPTTNGDFAQGEGLAAAEAAGASLVHMDQVQVHPTGFVDPADPAARTRFLAPEKLRGCGAVLVSHSGHRFVDELATREAVVQAMGSLHAGYGLMSGGPASTAPVALLVLPASAAQRYGEEFIKFYKAKSLLREYSGAEEAAAGSGCDAAALRQTLSDYNACCRGEAEDPHGKTVFPCQVDPDAPLLVGRVTPVVHYCMGGVRIDHDGRALGVGPQGEAEVVRGLYAAGEVSGGLHGRNRLAGNSLLECVVFGARAARAVAKELAARGAAEEYRQIEETELMYGGDGGDAV